MVPSWTETLLHCGANVVGRTRFCIHPEDSEIPVVGGTKNIDWEKVRVLRPDLILLDQEENPRSMSDESPFPTHATHVEKVQDVAPELKELAGVISDPLVVQNLEQLAERWSIALKKNYNISNWSNFPGVIKWVRVPVRGSEMKAAYVIWKKPFMAASKQTFIGSMLDLFGVQNVFDQEEVSSAKTKYPEFALEELPPDTVLLFSSEPFPFAKFEKEIASFPFSSALIDGESFSWFGLRSLEFLEKMASAR